MATNGQTGDHEVLAGIERAITGGSKPPATMRRAAEQVDVDASITAYTEDLAEQYRALGRHAFEHGQYIQQACDEHADRILSEHRKLATTVLTAERKLVSDAESFIGSARG